MIPDINLLPQHEKRQSDSKVLYILIGIIVLLSLSFFIWQYFSARAQIVSLEQEETNLIAQRDQLQSQIDANQNHLGSLEQSIEVVNLLSYPVSPLIDETKALQPTNSYLREYVFAEKNVTITIDFETLKDISQYISRLTNSAYFEDGQIVSITNYELTTDSTDETNFDVVPRKTAEISLLIDENFLATGGVQ